MGKKVKKGRGPPKGKRAASHSVNVVAQQCSPTVEAVDMVSVVKEKRSCPHLDKGFDLKQLSEKIGSSDAIRCEDCREGAADRREGKAKHGKKKGSASMNSKSESKALWICLQCGHYSCGGVGLPTTPQSHAVRHARLTHHPIAIKLENSHLRWCFPCSTLLPVEKMEENGEHKDLLSDIVKLIKGRPSERSSMDAEEVWFGGGTGSITSEIRLASTQSGSSLGNGGYVVRGLVNLGNTCFFNSIMQNLLALNTLRDYFLELDPNFGSLTISLKKIFVETKPEGSGLKNVINPRSFFSCVCTKAPQFRGYQQHDAHELLRCLLDSLSTEELGAKKKIRYSQDNETSSTQGRSFVDDVFGGQISSTVCCLECGHSSTVYEPFLDLSLPVPTKKPQSKRAQPVFRGKKPKLPPKRNGRSRQKIGKVAHSSTSVISESCSVAEPHIPDTSSSVSQNFPAVEESENEQVLENTAELTSAMSDSFAWMDYLEPEPVLDEQEQDATSENNDSLGFQGCEVANITQSCVLIENSSQSDDTQVCSLNKDLNLEPNSSLEEELPLLVKDSEVLLLPYKEEAEASSAAGCEQGELDFDGIGSLFDEPDVVVGPMPRPSLGDDAENSFMASESEPDEVDNSNSPVSVESCLAHFIKPECLSNENAWHCENCSKILQRRRLEPKKGPSLRSESSLQIRNLGNGDIKSSDADNSTGESSLSHNGKDDCLNRNCTKGKLDDEPSYSSSSNEACCRAIANPQASDSLDGPCNNTDKANHHEADEVEGDEIDSKSGKVMRDATKRVLVDKAPPILTIHLKRFCQDGRGRLSKLNGYIKFGETLDLRQYMDPRHGCRDEEKYSYSLVGVVEHSGSMRGGHYVAYVRGGDKSKGKGSGGGCVWYHASDAYVRQASLEEVLRSEAYILFYERS